MRSAYCVAGYTGGLMGRNVNSSPVDYRFCHTVNFHNVILPNHCDVFFHSWSVDEEKKIVSLYNPKKYICEPQIHPPEWPNESEEPHPFRWHSRWYGMYKAIQLKQEYEKENGFKYDWVFATRFDIVFRKRFVFSHLDNSRFYLAHYNGEGLIKRRSAKRIKTIVIKPAYDFCGFVHLADPHRVSDLWFLSNSSLMDEFSEIYNRLKEIGTAHPHLAAYSHLATMGGGDISHIASPHLHRFWDYELYRSLYWVNFYEKEWWRQNRI